MKEEMKKTKEIYFKERNKISFNFSSYIKLTKPNWMLHINDSRLEATYRDQKILFKEGKIALAKIAQANSLLFQPGKDDHLAAIVYSFDDFFENQPEKLADIATLLFRIKGERFDDEDLQMFSDIMADEKVALFNYKIPEKLAYGKEAFYTTIIISRKHLPNGYLDFDFFPILIYPEKTEASVILPSKYWSSDFLEKASLKYLAQSF